MLDVPQLINTLNLENSVLSWKPYPLDFELIDRFPRQDWMSIFPFIDTNPQWMEFLNIMSRISTVRLLYGKRTGMYYGFVYLTLHDYRKNIIEVHGGGWVKSIEASRLYYRGLWLIIKQILNSGSKIVTSWNKDNKNAERFLRSIGFVPYSYTLTHVYAWINKKRLESSPLTLKLSIKTSEKSI